MELQAIEVSDKPVDVTPIFRIGMGFRVFMRFSGIARLLEAACGGGVGERITPGPKI